MEDFRQILKEFKEMIEEFNQEVRGIQAMFEGNHPEIGDKFLKGIKDFQERLNKIK